MLEKTHESPLDNKIKPINLKGDQPWIFTGRTDAEAPVFQLSDMNRWLTRKVPDAGKDQGQKGKRVSEDEMVGWHHWFNEHKLGKSPGNDEGQGGLACYSPWVAKSRTWLGNWTITDATRLAIKHPWRNTQKSMLMKNAEWGQSFSTPKEQETLWQNKNSIELNEFYLLDY